MLFRVMEICTIPVAIFMHALVRYLTWYVHVFVKRVVYVLAIF